MTNKEVLIQFGLFCTVVMAIGINHLQPEINMTMVLWILAGIAADLIGGFIVTCGISYWWGKKKANGIETIWDKKQDGPFFMFLTFFLWPILLPIFIIVSLNYAARNVMFKAGQFSNQEPKYPSPSNRT